MNFFLFLAEIALAVCGLTKRSDIVYDDDQDALKLSGSAEAFHAEMI